MSDFDERFEECGIVGYYPGRFSQPSAQACSMGLYALQHRGQEAAGISVYNRSEGKILTHKSVGLVSQVFSSKTLNQLSGEAAIGHVRYSTCGASAALNAQPVSVSCRLGNVAIAHNGNLVNATALRSQLESVGTIFQSDLDTEIFCHLLSRSCEQDFEKALRDCLMQVQGAYSLVILKDDTLYAVRDPSGFRPLVWGRANDSVVIASETCALDLLGAKFEREVQPGELLRVTQEGITSSLLLPQKEYAPCVFELIYFARPDSTVFGENAYESRFRMGQQLAREYPKDADIVVPVPDSGVPAALGYSASSNLPYVMGLTRNHYIGRTFIAPGQDEREFKLRLKLNPISSLLEGKRIVLVDDSIVRGTTGIQIVRMLRKANVREIHLMLSSPPVRHPCVFGIDTPDRNQLLAAESTVREMKELLAVDSLSFLSMEGLMRSLGDKPYCRACFDGRYPLVHD